jgi:hypothetical protein
MLDKKIAMEIVKQLVLLKIGGENHEDIFIKKESLDKIIKNNLVLSTEGSTKERLVLTNKEDKQEFFANAIRVMTGNSEEFYYFILSWLIQHYFDKTGETELILDNEECFNFMETVGGLYKEIDTNSDDVLYRFELFNLKR